MKQATSKAFGWTSRGGEDAYVIISGYRVGHTPEGNHYRQRELHHVLKEYGVTFFEAQGAYEGELEESCVIPLHFEDTLDKVRKIAKDFDQETILILKDTQFHYSSGKSQYDLYSNAWLEWVEGGDRVGLGRFVKVDSNQISSLKAWTLIDGALYTCIDETEAAEAA